MKLKWDCLIFVKDKMTLYQLCREHFFFNLIIHKQKKYETSRK
jgi:hypothetical protein